MECVVGIASLTSGNLVTHSTIVIYCASYYKVSWSATPCLIGEHTLKVDDVIVSPLASVITIQIRDYGGYEMIFKNLISPKSTKP